VEVCSPQEWSSQYADALKELNGVEAMEVVNEQAGLATQNMRSQK